MVDVNTLMAKEILDSDGDCSGPRVTLLLLCLLGCDLLFMLGNVEKGRNTSGDHISRVLFQGDSQSQSLTPSTN